MGMHFVYCYCVSDAVLAEIFIRGVSIHQPCSSSYDLFMICASCIDVRLNLAVSLPVPMHRGASHPPFHPQLRHLVCMIQAVAACLFKACSYAHAQWHL